MVRLRPDPRGPHTAELYRWNASIGPFRRVHFAYNKYRYMDWATKHARICIGLTFASLSVFVGAIENYRILKGYSKKNPIVLQGSEKGFCNFEWGRDFSQKRGEWNNNFYCWSDQPDCGKDYKIKYTA